MTDTRPLSERVEELAQLHDREARVSAILYQRGDEELHHSFAATLREAAAKLREQETTNDSEL